MDILHHQSQSQSHSQIYQIAEKKPMVKIIIELNQLHITSSELEYWWNIGDRFNESATRRSSNSKKSKSNIWIRKRIIVLIRLIAKKKRIKIRKKKIRERIALIVIDTNCLSVISLYFFFRMCAHHIYFAIRMSA